MGLQEKDHTGAGTSKEAKNQKGKEKDIDRAKDELADSFLTTVRKLQLNRKRQEEEAVEVLSKNEYRAGKSISYSTSNPTSSLSVNSISNPSQNLGGSGERSKKGRKTSKFHRVRLGDNSAAALFDVPGHAAEEPSNKPPSERLPARGVWKNSGGQKLFG